MYLRLLLILVIPREIASLAHPRSIMGRVGVRAVSGLLRFPELMVTIMAHIESVHLLVLVRAPPSHSCQRTIPGASLLRRGVTILGSAFRFEVFVKVLGMDSFYAE